MIKSGVYKFTNIVNGKNYVGSSNNLSRRRCDHLKCLRKNRHINKHLQHAFNKYGENSFIWEILEYVSFNGEGVEPYKNLRIREQFWMDKLESYNSMFGYNINPIAESNRGRNLSEEHKELLRNVNIGNKNAQGHIVSEELKEYLRTKHTGRKMSKESSIKKSKALRGRVFTQEHKDKISKSLKGRALSQECKDKISLSKTGKTLPPFTQEHKDKISKSLKGIRRTRKPVLNVTTGMEFSCAKEAADYYHISHNHISSVCLGKRETCGKDLNTGVRYKWEYVLF